MALALRTGSPPLNRDFVAQTVRALQDEAAHAPETPMVTLTLPALPGIAIRIKDETAHPTGSLKHRLARSLFLHGLVSGRIDAGTTVVEASSGSTAVSEAYFARRLGLRFVAVVPRSTSATKLTLIEAEGGTCHLVADGQDIREESARVAASIGGVFMDQFTYAERASDWQGETNIAAAILGQLARSGDGPPAWVVAGAGTGGTITTIGRHLRYRGLPTRVCLVDPDRSVLHRHCGDRSQREVRGPSSLVEGIGRPRVEASFLPDLVDQCMAVEDAASIAAARVLSRCLGRRCGGSTGTAFWGVATLAARMAAAGQTGTIVFLICDGGERYAGTYFDDGWVCDNGLDLARHEDRLEEFMATGRFH